MTRVHKTDKWQYEQMKQWPESARPPDLRKESNGYSYEIIVGHPPTHWLELWRPAKRLWSRDSNEYASIDVDAYLEYCRDKFHDPRELVVVHRELRAAKFTPVAQAHGDLTIQNAINGRLFDPSPCHGLSCREIDEAKMMQSGEGLCRVYRGFPLLDMTGFEPRRVHYALLLTHYARMMPHVNEVAKIFARERINWIINFLGENPWKTLV